MGMTDRQYQGWLLTLAALIREKLKADPDNQPLREVLELIQAMLEDGTDQTGIREGTAQNVPSSVEYG